jgi:hypothetical protein
MRTLKDILDIFVSKDSLKQKIEVSDIPDEFKDIAISILSGCFKVTSRGNARKQVFVRPCSVEIYYHEEDGCNKDFIVYHRNKDNHKVKDWEKAYFDLGVLHNHVSGIDITFESSNRKFRASALIRAFEMNVEDGTAKPDDKTYKLLEIPEKGVEERSTYLYGALFSQFSIFDGFEINWVDNKYNVDKLYISERQNVVEFDETTHKKNKDKKPDMRRWRFSTYEPKKCLSTTQLSVL